MPDTTIYATRDELRGRMHPAGGEVYSSTNDAIHDAALETWSRAVDGFCNDFFGQVTATRHFTAEWPDLLVVPSLVSIASNGLKTDENWSGVYSRTWDTSDYLLWPFNAATKVPARPYLEVRVDYRTSSNGWTFPLGPLGVELAAVWGWPAVPSVVKDVVLLEAMHWLEQLQSPSGIVGNDAGEMEVTPALNPMSKLLLRQGGYVRMGQTVVVGGHG